MDAPDDAQRHFLDAQNEHAAGNLTAAMSHARQALAADPDYVEALEYIANFLITRQRKYTEGLRLIDRAIALRSHDPGIWYAHGWCYEFAAHELARRSATHNADLEPRALLETAGESFRRCLALHPEGKLADDASDLLDHVENELRQP